MRAAEPRRPLALCAGAWLLVLGASLALVVPEYFHYAAALEWERYHLGALEVAVVLWCLWVKSLVLLAPVPLCAHLARLARLRRGAWILTAALAVAGVSYLVIALCVHVFTGNPVTMYLPHLADPLAWKWGGGPWAIFGAIAAALAAVTVLVVPLLYFAARAGTWILARWGAPRWWTVLTLAVAALLLGLFPAQRLVREPVLLENLWEAFPADYGPLARIALDPQRALLDELLEPVYRRYDRTWKVAPIDATVRLGSEHLPNVILLVLESLRHDVLNDRVMPNLHRRARRGLVFARHYSGGNRSEFGFFALFYARSPLRYHATLDREPFPQANRIFRDNGYECILAASADLEWQRIGEFLGPTSFDRCFVQGTDDALNEGDWAAHDHATLARIAELARQSERAGRPRFLVGYLMSTHFNYDYPPGHERFKPAAPRTLLHSPLEREASLNRYRNAAAFLDEEVEGLLASIDLERNLVVVTGDHGESIFDDGTFSHGSLLSEIQVRVPLVMVGAGIPRGRSIERITTHLDVLPTLLHLLVARPVPVRAIQGRDQLEANPPPDDAMVVGEYSAREMQVLLLRGDDRLVLRLGKAAATVRAQGFVDERARRIPHACAPAELERWAEVFERHLSR